MRVCAGNSDTDVEIVEIDEMGVVNGVRERRGTRLRGECCVEGEGWFVPMEESQGRDVSYCT